VKANKRLRDLRRRVKGRIKNFFLKPNAEPKLEEITPLKPKPTPLTVAEELEQMFKDYQKKGKNA
jgi:hypothetical protein